MEACVTSTSQYVTLLIPPTAFLYWRQAESTGRIDAVQSVLLFSRFTVSRLVLEANFNIWQGNLNGWKVPRASWWFWTVFARITLLFCFCNLYWALQHAEGCIPPVGGVNSGEVIQLFLKHLQKTTILSGYHSRFLLLHSHAADTDESTSEHHSGSFCG